VRRLTLLALAGAAAVAIIAVFRPAPPRPVARPFGQHWPGLEARRVAANVATMGRPSSRAHTHLHLRVWVEGRRVGVPAGIGIDPARSADAMAALHTHTDDGKVHNEGQANARLGQLMVVWGVGFGSARLGPYRSTDAKRVQMWVDGRPSAAWGALPLEDGQQIDLAYGRPRSRPPGD
jgi:hypothetical protein